MTAERRRFPRYITPEVEFQVFSKYAKMIGQLANISKGGLAFRFSPGPGKTPECRSIDITGTDAERFHLPAISCRRVYEISELAEGQSFSGGKTRRCGVQFLDLTDKQEQELDFLLDHYGSRLNDIP